MNQQATKLNARNVSISAIVVGLLFTLHFATPPPGGLWLRTLYDSMHIPVFGLIATGVLLLTPANWNGPRRFVVAFAVTALLAALSEVAQIPTVRNASLKDFAADMLGAVGFMCIAMAVSRSFSVRRVWRPYLIPVALVSIALPLTPLATVSASYVAREQALPDLVRFDSRFSDLFFKARYAELAKIEDETSGEVSAEILLGDGQWPGIAFTDIWPDWEAYEALVVEIENPEADDLPITIRVNDRRHRHNEVFDDRFNRRVELVPGRQRLRIDLSEVREAPAGRMMDMTEVDDLVFFSTRQEAGRRFVIHRLCLVSAGTD